MSGPALVIARSLLELSEKLAQIKNSNGHGHPKVTLACNAWRCRRTNRCLLPDEECVVVCGEFRCMACLAQLVELQQLAFATAFGVEKLHNIHDIVEPYQPLNPETQPFAAHLYQLKKTPPFVCI